MHHNSLCSFRLCLMRIHNFYDMMIIIGTYQNIQLRQLCRQFVGIFLHQAAYCRQKFACTLFFPLCQFQNGIDRLFFRCIDKAACIDNNYFRFVIALRQFISMCLEQPHHRFTVHQIFGTAQRYYTHLLHIGIPLFSSNLVSITIKGFIFHHVFHYRKNRGLFSMPTHENLCPCIILPQYSVFSNAFCHATAHQQYMQTSHRTR